MIAKSKKIKASFIAIVTVVLFFALSWYYVTLIDNALKAQTFLYLSEVGTRGAALVESKVDNELENMETTARLIEAHGDYDQNAMLKLITLQATKGHYKRMGIALPDGTSLTTDGLSVNVAERDYFKEAINGKATVSDTINDYTDNEPINVYAVPIFKENQVVGLVLASVNTEDLKKYLEVESFTGQGYSYIVKANGDAVVTSTHANSPGDFENILELLKKADLRDGDTFETIAVNMAAGKSGSFTSFYGGMERHTIYKPLAINDWYMMTVVPTQVVSTQTQQISWYSFSLIVAALLAMTLLFVIILIFQYRSKRRLERVAYVDEVTGGNNWQKFKQEATEILESKNCNQCALLTFDIDRFRFINEEYGHEKGDQVLRLVVGILEKRMAKQETYARVSGDHFAILCVCDDQDKITRRIKEFIQILNDRRETIGIKEKLSCHFGIYIIEDKTGNLEKIREKANMARIAAKTAENQRWFFYSDAFRKKIGEEKEIIDQMEDALENQEFEMYLQPKYNLHTNRYCGCEALVRWRNPHKGLISPGEFIPIFEQTGFIKKLDMFMLEEVCRILKRWETDGYPEISISVNLSRKNLKQSDFVERVLNITNQYRIKRSNLEIELTESSIFENVDRMIEIGEAFRLYGFKMAMDDFGSGYSSINLLGNLPLDVIKMDQGFFNSHLKREQNLIVVESVIKMIKKLGMTVVAEGIETEAEVDLLRSLGCDIIQGYYFGKPMTVFEFEEQIF
ncbi:EAL domain-containing protein [Acetobacterium wieringae]|uniref:bifunctional diguanylate cyclase/phosphodiesterase n=1 Tax=Acetobacterium wieringae TaxID=52694 RepID=UPI0020348F96|nr:EAL domain-containing protein [Acetobacterium wieringae]URN84603.1 EAL domain-containing protein [Acetobacterium wieringae]